VGDCTELLDFSTGVTLTAVPNPDAIFVSWTGDAVCAGKTTTACSFKLPNRTVNVTPVYRTRTIVGLSKGGNGAGSLTATGTLSPAAPVCGPTCTSTLFTAFDGRPVTLRATPSAGSSFGSFSGDCVSNSSTCTYIPSGANSTVTGTFVLQQFGLLVANRANGSVSGSLAGVGEVVLCGDAALDCSESVEFGRSVVLVATPAPGFTFLNWSGDPVCAGRTNATCPFTMPLRNVSVTPSYRRATLVQVTPVGQGTVTGTGISCVSGQAGVTGDCTQVVLNNGSLTLTATPATGWDFDQWDDPSSCAGTPVCTFTPTGETALSGPVFVREQRFASVVVSGNGSVVSGFDGCDTATSPCQFPRLFGDTVVLTATPAAGQQFFSWTGCQSTNGSACTLLMTANRTATVSFLPIAAATVTVGQGSLAFSAPSVTVAAGDTVRWTWASSNHNVVSGPISGAGAGVADGAFCNPGDVSCATAPLVGPPTVYSHTFTTPGTFTYFCRQHRTLGMTGTVTVTE
jgi:plastocyanin